MWELRNALGTLIARQREAAKLLDEGVRAAEQLEETLRVQVQEYFDDILDGVEFSCDIMGGCRTPHWSPSLTVVGILRKSYTYRRTADGWVAYPHLHDGVLYRHKVVQGAPPVDAAALESAVVRLSEMLTPVVVRLHRFEWSAPKDPRTPDDLLALHPGGSVVAHGITYYEGWDIGDPWAVVRDAGGGVHCYYATNSHGYGYDVHIPPNGKRGDYQQFFAAVQRRLPVEVQQLLGLQ